MLKKIAVACSECTEKHKNADHVVPDLSDSLAMIENRWKDKLKKETLVFAPLSELFSNKLVENSLIKQIIGTGTTSVSFSWGRIISNWLKTLLEN